MITAERRDEMYSLWCNETSEPETEEWRWDLTEEEQELIVEWDNGCTSGILRMAKDILENQPPA
ncbi:MAG: hypothetical protein IKU94_06860 [Bacteroidaceae bacterium]|nr:hypothetical protein [Bacteroidaceae bacterium]